MARGAGVALKTLQVFLRAIEFCCAAVILALFSYFLAKLSVNHIGINAYLKSVEGISGVAVVYTALSILLVCFVGGLGFFALLAFILDICFLGAFIYIAWETRHGASSCRGNVITPFGDGNPATTATEGTLPGLRTACKMQTANFAVAIVAILFFLLSAMVEVALWRHHKSEKKYGPGPANGYTAGSGKPKFWQRKNKNNSHKHAEEAAVVGGAGALATEKHHHHNNTNNNSLPTHTVPAETYNNHADTRPSYATDNTMVGPEPIAINKYGHIGNGGVGDGYAAPPTHHHGTNYNETARVPDNRY